MRRLRLLVTVMALSFVWVGITQAHDYWIPEWRGKPGTTLGVWDTWSNYPGPMPADRFSCHPADLRAPYAEADPASAFLMDSWTDSLGENRWNVLHIIGDDELMFHLDNYDRNRPKKLVRIQISYDSDHAWPLAFNGTAGYEDEVVPFHVPANLVAITEPPGWVTAAYEFSIAPNPKWEEIYLKFDWDSSDPERPSAYVDQVVIDTWCVPEPCTLALLGMGAVALLFWRRRR